MADTSNTIKTLYEYFISTESVYRIALYKSNVAITSSNYSRVLPANTNDPSYFIMYDSSKISEDGSLEYKYFPDPVDNTIKYVVKSDVITITPSTVIYAILQKTAASDKGTYSLYNADLSIKKEFNAVVFFSQDKRGQYNIIAIVSYFMNTIDLSKVLNFNIKLVIEADSSDGIIDIDYNTQYLEHRNLTDKSYPEFQAVHPNLIDQTEVQKDAFGLSNTISDLISEYKQYVIDPATVRIKVLESSATDFIEEGIPGVLQVYPDQKVNYYDKYSLKTQYLYFFYEDISSIMKTVFQFSSTDVFSFDETKIKLGFNEEYGPYLYNWVLFKSAFYIVIYGCNSNKAIDVYSINIDSLDITDYDVNSADADVFVGRYVDRIYFVINDILYFLIPNTSMGFPLNTTITDYKDSVTDLNNLNQLDITDIRTPVTGLEFRFGYPYPDGIYKDTFINGTVSVDINFFMDSTISSSSQILTKKSVVIKNPLVDITDRPLKLIAFNFTDMGDILYIKNNSETVFDDTSSAGFYKYINILGEVSDNPATIINKLTYGNLSDAALKKLGYTFELSRLQADQLSRFYNEKLIRYGTSGSLVLDKDHNKLIFFPKTVRNFKARTKLDYSGGSWRVNNNFIIQGNVVYDTIFQKMYTSTYPMLAYDRGVMVVKDTIFGKGAYNVFEYGIPGFYDIGLYDQSTYIE